MPRMRWAIRSGWKRSKSSSFSPVEAKRIGLPVTALTESAAPPRASPSSLVITTPSNSADLGEDLGDADRVLAGHRVDDQQHVVRAWSCLRIRASSSISSSSMWRRPAVSTISTSRRSLAGALERPGGDVDRVGVGALLVDVGAGALADRDPAARPRPGGRRRRRRARRLCPAC